MNDDESPMTFNFAPEIEDATISIIWHEPERLAEFLRHFDPDVHLAQAHCRIILEAVILAFGELGASDFPTVMQVVRELDRLEECGNVEGLNRVYSCVEANLPNTDKIYAHYLDMLRIYARHRKTQHQGNMCLFTGGRALVKRNSLKSKPYEPDYVGDARVRGRNYSIRGWDAGSDEGVTLTLEPR